MVSQPSGNESPSLTRKMSDKKCYRKGGQRKGKEALKVESEEIVEEDTGKSQAESSKETDKGGKGNGGMGQPTGTGNS